MELQMSVENQFFNGHFYGKKYNNVDLQSFFKERIWNCGDLIGTIPTF